MRPICAGISRASRFSPNRECNDSAVFSLTVNYLEENGFSVRTYTEEEFIRSDGDERWIFHMARGHEILEYLAEKESRGSIIVNSVQSIKNCRRDILTHILLQNGIPYPESFTADTSMPIDMHLRQSGIESCWLKRSDTYAMCPEDICFARTGNDAQRLLPTFSERGIASVVVNRHLPGDLIKFYGIDATPFFYWCHPSRKGFDKFGYERINGSPTFIPFKEDMLRDICSRAARLLGLYIYGGDAIVSPDGSIHLIDLNDWPSFSPCLHEAVAHIGSSIIKKFNR